MKKNHQTGQNRNSRVRVHGRKKHLIGVVLVAEKRIRHYLASRGMLMVLVSVMMVMVRQVVDKMKIVPNQTERVVVVVEEAKSTSIDGHS